MEAILLASDILGKVSVLCSNLEAEIEAFHLHLVTTTYVENMTDIMSLELSLAGFTMVWVAWI